MKHSTRQPAVFRALKLGELDRLSPFDILTDILELTPKNAFPGLLDMLEERKAKFMNLAGQSTIARENNLDSVHRQLVLAYIDACKRLSGHGDSLILGRLSVFCFQILPFNSKLVLSKTSKVSKVELHNVELDGYKDLWTLINFLQDPLDLFSYDSKMKKYRLASTDREAKRFKEMMKVIFSSPSW